MKRTREPPPTSRSVWLIAAKSNLICGLAWGAPEAGVAGGGGALAAYDAAGGGGALEEKAVAW
jgi:hypothetical protein